MVCFFLANNDLASVLEAELMLKSSIPTQHFVKSLDQLGSKSFDDLKVEDYTTLLGLHDAPDSVIQEVLL